MTNERIIFNESQRLMAEGILKGSGTFVNVEFEDGTNAYVELAEEIHTFNGWKQRGYSVKKGEKSKIKIAIWKYTEKEKPEEEKTGNPLEDAPITNMFMKTSAFFTLDQVEPIKQKAMYLPAPKLQTANA
jgi:antirestriction protein ArdC